MVSFGTVTSQRYTGDNLRYYISGWIDEAIRYRTPSPLVTMCPTLFWILWVTAVWISCNFTAPLGLITVICKMPQEGDDSHRAVQPSKVLLKLNYQQPRYCMWHFYRRTGAEPEALHRIYCGGVGENECAQISFQTSLYCLNGLTPATRPWGTSRAFTSAASTNKMQMPAGAGGCPNTSWSCPKVKAHGSEV